MILPASAAISWGRGLETRQRQNTVAANSCADSWVALATWKLPPDKAMAMASQI